MLLVFFMVLCWFVCLLTVFWVVNVLLFGVLCYLGYLVVFSDGMNVDLGWCVVILLLVSRLRVWLMLLSVIGLVVYCGFVVLWCLRAGAFRGVCLLCLLLFADWLFRHIGVTVMILLGGLLSGCYSCGFACLWFVGSVCGYVWWVFGFRVGCFTLAIWCCAPIGFVCYGCFS